MTNDEAVKWIKEHHCPDDWYNDCKDTAAMRKAIEALEKQIPKKPIYHDTTYIRSLNDYLCPSCKRYVERGHRCHYNDCGQAIDWSDE